MINYSTIRNKNIWNLNSFLREIEWLKVADITISDLIFYKGDLITTGNGVYIFRHSDEYIYVGSCVARNFVKRIPAHFDLREGDHWLNAMVNRMISVEHNGCNSKEEAGRLAISEFELLLINFEEYDREAILNLEDLLRIVLLPLNQYRRKRIRDGSTLRVIDYLRRNRY
ncbi:MAG: GIY-YIG nuclease family protein [Bacteroidota bacterium]